MLKTLCIVASLALTGAAFAQYAQPGQTTPSVTPSDTPAVTPSQTPSALPPSAPPVAPADTPSATPPTASPTPPATSTTAPATSTTAPVPTVAQGLGLGGLSRCENLIGSERETCLQQERSAATGGTAGRPAGAVR